MSVAVGIAQPWARAAKLPRAARAGEIDRGRPDHAACGGDERRHRLAPAQRAVAERHRLPDLLAGDGEEERHQHVVDEVVQGQRAVRMPFGVDLQMPDRAAVEQREIDEGVVAVGSRLAQASPARAPDDQERRIVGNEPPGAVQTRLSPAARSQLSR